MFKKILVFYFVCAITGFALGYSPPPDKLPSLTPDAVAFMLITGSPPSGGEEGPTYLESSGFEDDTADAKWTRVDSSGSFNDDYTTVHPEGAQACQIVGGDESRTIAWSGQDGAIYVVGIIYPDSTGGTGTNYPVKIQQAAGTNISYLQFVWSVDHWVVHLYYESGGDYIGPVNATDQAAFYFKIYYNNTGSGAYGFWADQDTSLNEIGTDAESSDSAQVGKVMINCDSGFTFVFDDFRVDDEDITF